MKGPVRLVGRKYKEGVGEGWLRVAQRPRLRGGGEPGPQARVKGTKRKGEGDGTGKKKREKEEEKKEK